MLKKEFEKRHGKINYDNATAGGKGYVKLPKKHNLLAEDQPAAIWWIAQNMPYVNFNQLNPKQLQTIFKYMPEIKEKEVRDYYLGLISYLYLNGTYGWFSRGGHGLYTFGRDLEKIQGTERQAALKILRMLKREFIKYKYRDGYADIHNINHMIKRLGGVQDTMKTFDNAKSILTTNVARKQKKDLKKQGIWATLTKSR